MPGLSPTGRKKDESDFEFQVQDMKTDADRSFTVSQGRVLDVPTRHKTVGSGTASKSIAVCAHSRLITHPCATCEWEAPRLLEAPNG